MNYLSHLLIIYFKNYSTLFLSILIISGCIGIPTGASLVVIASGAFAYAGQLNIVILLLEIWFFSCLGDNIAYIIWKIIGDRLLNNSLKIRNHFEPKIIKSQNYLKKYGKGSIFFSRFLISAMGPFVNAAAGITKYRLPTFNLFVALGELLWACMYLGLGYWFGDSWESIVPIVTQVVQILTYISVLIIAIYFFIKMLKKNKKKK